jgi:uncharacterized coiled-coil DUF342 family protein
MTDLSTESTSKRAEANKRYYEKRKQALAVASAQELPDTIETLTAKLRDISTRLAELRKKAQSSINIPSDPSKAKVSTKAAAEIIEQCKGDWQLVLMISEDLRTQALRPY